MKTVFSVCTGRQFPFRALCLAALAFLIVSCADNQGLGRIITQTDTLRIHDTTRIDIRDTIHTTDTINTTDTLYDTARIPLGKPGLLLAGIIVADIDADSESVVTDSCFGSVVAYANPEQTELVVACNGNVLSYDQNQNRDFMIGSIADPLLLPSFAGAVYDGFFADSLRRVTCTVLVPSYAADSTTVLTFDTLQDSVAIPGKIGNLRPSRNGVGYDSIDYFASYGPTTPGYRLEFDKNLDVSWDSAGAWYAVECAKYFEYNGRFYVVGESFDTLVSSPHVTIPQSYFFQDTTYDSSKSYHLLYISVVPVLGPSPDEWPVMPSWEGRGYLFGIRAVYPEAALNADPFVSAKQTIAKRSATRAQIPSSKSADIVARALSKALQRSSVIR